MIFVLNKNDPDNTTVFVMVIIHPGTMEENEEEK